MVEPELLCRKGRDCLELLIRIGRMRMKIVEKEEVFFVSEGLVTGGRERCCLKNVTTLQPIQVWVGPLCRLSFQPGTPYYSYRERRLSIITI